VDGSYGDPLFDEERWTQGERDPSGVVVLKVASPGVKAEQVATFCGYVHPTDELPSIVDHLGRLYGDATNDNYPAMVACEVNAGSPSAQTQQELINRGYPNFYVWQRPNKVGGGFSNFIGWDTNPSTRGWITTGLVKEIEDGTVVINSIVSIEQMKTFVRMRTDVGRVRLDHQPGYHDDELFATGIALFVATTPGAQMFAKEAARSEKLATTPAAEPRDLQHTGAVWVPGEGWQGVTRAVAVGNGADDYGYPLPD